MQPINLHKKFSTISQIWQPELLTSADFTMRFVKALGDFGWHNHADSEKILWVVSGVLQMEFPDQHLCINAGECLIVPKNCEHRPYSDALCEIILIEKTERLEK